MSNSLPAVLPCVVFFGTIFLPLASPEGAPGGFSEVRELSVYVPGASILSSASTGTSDILFGVSATHDPAPSVLDGVVVRAVFDSGGGCDGASLHLNGAHQQDCSDSPCFIHLPQLGLKSTHRLSLGFFGCHEHGLAEHVTTFSIVTLTTSQDQLRSDDRGQCQHAEGECITEDEPIEQSLEAKWREVVERTCGPAPEGPCARAEPGGGARAACSGHGRCSTLGFCFCFGDWVGETCAHNVLVNATYLPARHPSASAHGCAQAVRWNIQSGGLTRALEEQQRQRCSSTVSTVVLDTLGLALGGQINLASLALAHAFNRNSSLVLHGRWKYGDHAGCLVPGRACYFRTPLACTDHQLRAKGVELRPRGQGGDILEHTDTFAVRGGLRPPEEMRGHGLFWWSAHMLSYTVRPSLDLEAKVRLAALQAGFVRPSIGVHVRHGDACVHAAQSNSRPLCRPFDDYIPPLLTMQQRYGISAVFLSTDDSSVVAEARRKLSPLGFTVSNLPLDRSVFESSWFIEHRVEAQALDAQVIADSMLVDLFLLRECDYLVGTLASQMSRLALSLISHRLGMVPPYASVDGMGAGCCAWAGENLEGFDNAAYRNITHLH